MSPQHVADEIEAKLIAPDESTLRAIGELKRLGRFELETVGRARLQSTYLDTRDRRLLERRVALRVRQANSAWEMTAKWDRSVEGDVHVRQEVNVPLEDRPAPPYPLPPGPLSDKISPLVGDRPLEPLLVTEIDRATALFRDQSGAAIAELALDVVQHSAPASSIRCAPYYEVEVELLEGPPAAIGEISGLLRSTFALERTGGSKFSRAMNEIYGIEG